jgi:hypothetical protein
MAVWPRINVEKTFRVACWRPDGFCGRNLKPGQFLSDHGADICLLNKKHFESDRTPRFTSYVCHRTDRPTCRGGTEMPVEA